MTSDAPFDVSERPIAWPSPPLAPVSRTVVPEIFMAARYFALDTASTEGR